MTQVLHDHDLQALAKAIPALAGAAFDEGPAALASPSYRGLDAQSGFFTTLDSGRWFVKQTHPEMRSFYDATAGSRLAQAAGEADVGPKVFWQDAARSAIAFEALSADWRTANMADLQDGDFVAAVMGQVKRLHGLDLDLPRFDPFARIGDLLDLARHHAVPLPEDMAWIEALLDLARPVLTDCDLVACRNDGSSSNLMRGPAASALLVDFDRAGLNDPMYDLGVLLIEITDFDRDMRPAFMAYHGGWEESAFARARLWAVVDDVLHALQSRICGAMSDRKHLEWLKYGEWRLMRARLALHHPAYEEKIRIAGGRA